MTDPVDLSKRGRRKESRDKLAGKSEIDTYDSWLKRQHSHGTVKAKGKQPEEGTMPSDTMEAWLRKQVSHKIMEESEILA